MNSLASSSVNIPVALLVVGFILLLSVFDSSLEQVDTSEEGIVLQQHIESSVIQEYRHECEDIETAAPESIVPEHPFCWLEIGIVLICIVLPALYYHTRPDKISQASIVSESSIHDETERYISLQHRSSETSTALRNQSPGARRLAHWNQAINNAAKASNLEKAESLLEDMYQNGDQPDIISYNSVIQACAKRGEVERARRWLSEMNDKDIKPNTITYNNLMDCCVKANDTDGAEYWLDHMAKEGVVADDVSFAIAINGRAKKGEMDSAESFLNKMPAAGVEPNVASYSSLMHACGRHGRSALG
jgi:pentatricopeptide repeat protein